ncbi:hypothetical protein PQX77_010237 [Marasmius sp. AFHP31]|nr:hypothetical protein PQX77_010237 [Marasmius sp. AFHP31]
MISRFFHRATNTRFGHNSVFQHVEGNVNHNYFSGTGSCEQEEDRIVPKQNEFREFLKGDVNLREQTWSEETEMVVRVLSRDNRPYKREVETKVRVVKRLHTATILQHGERTFTVVTFEPKDEKGNEIKRLLWKAGYEAYSGYK